MFLSLRSSSVLTGLALALCASVSAPAPARAQGSGSAMMTGTIVTAITVTGSDLVFGNVVATDTRRVAAPSGGRFVITLAAGTPVTVGYTLPASLGPSVTLGDWELLCGTVNDPASAQRVPVAAASGSFSASSPNGTLYVWIGATVTTSNAAVGTYSRPITLTVTYN